MNLSDLGPADVHTPGAGPTDAPIDGAAITKDARTLEDEARAALLTHVAGLWNPAPRKS